MSKCRESIILALLLAIYSTVTPVHWLSLVTFCASMGMIAVAAWYGLGGE